MGRIIGRALQTSDTKDCELIHFEIASLSGLIVVLFGTIILYQKKIKLSIRNRRFNMKLTLVLGCIKQNEIDKS